MMVYTSEFPIGMRVLAIDEDRVALEHLESMLKQCQYRAICTSQAITALKLLQDDKYKCDLIISDVDMPGIDGHKLFEHVLSLNTEIPIILLSERMSKELVMQGITSGACEFMVKPVRIEELKNIWRHVVRRRNNLNPKEMNNPNWPCDEFYETPKALLKIENFDHIPKPYSKRKYQQNGEKKHEENEKHEDLLTRKKRRVVWTRDLHHKFVEAVDKLGLEKAVPKRILELMNDENLTRENVASHLQKYRLFLKKSSEQANKVTSFGSAVDSAYDQNFSGFDNMRSIAGNMCISHPVPANIGNRNGQVYSDIEQNVGVAPGMSFSSSSWTSDFYNPSKFRDLSGFQDDSLTSCVSKLPDIKSELHYQTQQVSHVVDHNMNQNVWNGLNSDFSNELDHALCFSPGLFFGGSAFPMIDETYGLVRDTNLDDSQLDHAELITGLWLEKQAMNYSYNSDLVDVTKKGEIHVEYST